MMAEERIVDRRKSGACALDVHMIVSLHMLSDPYTPGLILISSRKWAPFRIFIQIQVTPVSPESLNLLECIGHPSRLARHSDTVTAQAAWFAL